MENKDNLTKKRHSLAHILAEAVLNLFPNTKTAIGPSIDNGFYYDFEFVDNITEKDLMRLEEEMRQIIKLENKFKCQEIKESEAKELFKDNPYKKELLEEIIKDKKPITIYNSGNFSDLCEGGHIESAKEIDLKSFKLDRIAGAYWRGNEKNKMLTRIYGLAFSDKKELDEYLVKREEAEKRDHRKLGKELDLFCFSDIVGAGLPLFTPKGTIIKDELQKHIENVCRRYGFEKVSTPHLAKIDLYELSGHAKKFGNELFRVSSEAGHSFAMKPVQCPHQTQIYASRLRSYRDLPIRYMESEKQYRAEKTGEVGGLTRVYAITVEDGHSFCRPDQVKEEIINMINIIKDFYTSLGLWKNHWVSLSVRDYDHPEKYIGESADWDECERILTEIADELKLDAKRCEGEAALYGPKLDFMFKDALGKEIQIPTVQLDFATPKKFNLTYIDKDGSEKNPIMIHRAILGSYERFMALLIEHFAGAFPLWLSPVQIKILPVSQNQSSYAESIESRLKENDLRAEIDASDETLGKKIRKAKLEKVPYIIVIGEKEMNQKNITVEKRGEKEGEEMNLDNLIEKLKIEIKSSKK